MWQLLSQNPKIKEPQGSTNTLYLSVFTVFFWQDRRMNSTEHHIQASVCPVLLLQVILQDLVVPCVIQTYNNNPPQPIDLLVVAAFQDQCLY